MHGVGGGQTNVDIASISVLILPPSMGRGTSEVFVDLQNHTDVSSEQESVYTNWPKRSKR